MSEFAERLSAHYRAPATRIRVVLPQWAGLLEPDSEGEPAVYATPFTFEDRYALQQFGLTPEADSFEYAAEVVLRKLESESGERLFDRGDKPALISALPADVVTWLADVIARDGLDTATAPDPETDS